MQPFRVASEARNKFFKKLYDKNTFNLGFDAFYFCFIAGITTKRKNKIPQDKTIELPDHFPEIYQPRGKLLVGMFLSAELALLGVSMDERDDCLCRNC